MLRRINPIVLVCLAIILILSVGVFAVARPGGVTGADALGVGKGQLGKPFAMSTDGPGSFSCTGLLRYILRTTGVDPNAPWTPEEYLSVYAPVDLKNLQPGDIVIMPNWATMYAGDGMLLNANEWSGVVKYTPLEYAGAPLGAVRPPYEGSKSGALQPLTDAINGRVGTEPVTAGPAVTGQMPGEQPAAADPLITDPLMTDPLMTDPLITDPLLATDPLMTDPAVATDPLMTDPVVATDPLMVDPLMTDPVVTDPVMTDPLIAYPLVAEQPVVVTEPIATELPAQF